MTFVTLGGLILIVPTDLAGRGETRRTSSPRAKPSTPPSAATSVNSDGSISSPLTPAQEVAIGPVVQSLLTLQVSALEHPGAAPLAQIYNGNEEAAKALEHIVQQLRDRGMHYECGIGAEVLWVDPTLVKTSIAVQVLAHVRRATCRLLNAGGEEVEAQPGYERRAFAYGLRFQDGTWYIASERDLGNA